MPKRRKYLIKHQFLAWATRASQPDRSSLIIMHTNQLLPTITLNEISSIRME
jgi:hypothetical protein